jgi:hypothetical protein
MSNEYRPDLRDAIKFMGGEVILDTMTGFWLLFWNDVTVKLDAKGEEAAIKAAYRWLIEGDTK